MKQIYYRSEYWKSNPRKYCDFCSCWIADNKPSIDYHEKGKRHQENVKIKLDKISKKGKEDYQNKLNEDEFMKNMEQAAVNAYKKDIQSNPDLTAKQIIGTKYAGTSPYCRGKKLKWFEAKSPDGSSYFWHADTTESVWEVPKEGFVSLEEQKKQLESKQPTEQEPKKKEKSSRKVKVKKRKEKNSTVIYGPQQLIQPYNSWQSTMMPQKEVDLQLPDVSSTRYSVPEFTVKRKDGTFAEKVVTLCKEEGSNTPPVFFKKRKRSEDHKQVTMKRVE